MITLFQNTFFLKNFLHTMAVLGDLAKLRRGLQLTFCEIICTIIPKKCSVFNTLPMDKVSMSHLISFSRYQTKCVIKFLFRQLMLSWSLRFFLNQPLKQWLTGKKMGRPKYKNLNISRATRAFSMKSKTFFIVTGELSFDEK